MTALVPATEPSIFEYLAGLAEKFAAGQKSANTTRAYRLDIIGCASPLGTCTPESRDAQHRHRPSAWLLWCAANHLDPLAARPSDVLVWLADLAATGEASGTRARRLASVSSWYRWLVRDEVATRNPADLRTRERPAQRTPGTAGTALSREQMAMLIQAADRSSPRATAIVATLLLTGMRVAELVTLDIEDIGHDRGHSILTVHGKGDKIRLAPIVPVLYERIHAYLSTRHDLLPTNLPTQTPGGTRPRRPLFASSTGHRLDRAYVARLVARMSAAAGLPMLTPHDLRRTFTTLALDEGIPLRDVQDAVGHADPRTTRGYDRSGMNPDRHPAYRLGALISGPH